MWTAATLAQERKAMTAQNGVRRRKKASSAVLSYDEIVKRYPAQWILLEVTGEDEHRNPSEGYVLAHSRSRGRINQALAKEPRPSELPPDAPQPLYCIFQAYPRVYSGKALAEIIARWEAEGEPRGRLPLP